MKMKLLLLIILLVLTFPLTAQDEDFTAQELADENGQFIDIDGVEIYYVEYGATSDPAVLLLHGFGGSTFTWRDNMEVIAEAGYRVIAFDRPPYGLSDKEADIAYTPEAYIELTASFMDALEIESAALVGHSAGGRVIADFALAYPERVEALVFVAGAVGIERGDNEGSGLSSAFSGLANINPNAPLAQQLVRQILTPERFAEILTSAYYDPDTVTPETVEGYGRALRVKGWEKAFLRLLSQNTEPEDFDLDSLKVVDVPVLLIWGKNDTWVPLEVGERLHDLWTDSSLIIYDETGHLPMEEQTEQFNMDFVNFLKSIDF